MNREEGIKIIAYHIWEEEGRSCHGNDVQHWLKAETIWKERNKPSRMAEETGSSIRNQPTNTNVKIKPDSVFGKEQNKKDQFSRRKL